MSFFVIMKGQLIIISAPSGTGKTTVIKSLLDRHPEFVLSVSCTTRSCRPGEKDGVDYHFVDGGAFQTMIDDGQLLEWTVYSEDSYGTPRKPIEDWVRKGKTVILDIDVVGGRNIKKIFPNAALIFLLPPSKEELVRRLTLRGTNDRDDLSRRIVRAEAELAEKDFYDFQVVNDQVERAVGEIEKIIKKMKLSSPQ